MSAATLTAPARIATSLTLVDARLYSAQEIIEGRFIVRLARTSEEIDAALKLRFEVFNLEFGEGPAASFLTGRDYGEFDLTSRHLIVIDRWQRQVIGTCRLRTLETAKTIHGFHSSSEFDLSALPDEVLANAMEVDRICVAKTHRDSRLYKVLWKGLAMCLLQDNKSYAFGSLSLATQDPMAAGRIFDRLKKDGHLHPELTIKPKPGFKCFWYALPEGRRSEIEVPGWFRICLRFGTKLCGPPALNRQFRTINFPVLLDIMHRRKGTSLEHERPGARP